MKKTSAYRCTGFDVLEVDIPLKVLHELEIQHYIVILPQLVSVQVSLQVVQ